MKTLMVVKITHTASDQGSFGQNVMDARARRVGRVSGDEMERRICARWKEIGDRIHRAFPDPKGIVVYQDSLCVELKEDILKALEADKEFSSPNDRLLQELMRKGATIEGTESLALVGECIGIFKEASNASTPYEQHSILARYAPRIRVLLGARDKFIAERIDSTLSEGSKGILFIGAAHHVEAALAIKKSPGTFTILYV